MDTLHRLRLLAFLLACCSAGASSAAPPEHSEFEATLYAPYAAKGARTFTLSFDYPGLQAARPVAWRLELVAPSGALVRRWQGRTMLAGAPVDVALRWQERAGRQAPGIYRVRMRAALGHDAIEQSWEIEVGNPKAPVMPGFVPLPTAHGAPALQAYPALGALPYKVYYGNLHSQTNHSDGGGDVATCKGAQEPQQGRFGPGAAYAYAQAKGLDMLVTSEHNHLYDGADGINRDADAGKGRALFHAGLAAAADYTAAHRGFLAVYGLEWGVINGGGHLNVFNTTELLGWEQGANGELVADTRTPRNDYGALYTLMKDRGWIGQFNHPSYSGQFVVNGVPLGYTKDGDEAMVLCEVLNSNAFSTNESGTERRRSTYEVACNKALEAGYHVAFSSNQDNHCANWGASFTNRTAVLVPDGAPLTQASFVEALRARRVFATMDKDSQLVLTANAHIMGERFVNRGPLALVANFASAAGKKVASVALMEGVPGRNGKVTQLAASATATVTPTAGEHFYYAKVTQEDGNILWSAPVWVTQLDGTRGP